MADDFDVAIVGAGIAGVSTAYFAARRGLRVAVLDPLAPGQAQSGRAWGFIRRYGRGVADYALATHSRELWQDLASITPTDLTFRSKAYLRLAIDSDSERAIQSDVAAAVKLGRTDIELITGAQIRDRFAMVSGPWSLGAVSHGEGCAEPETATGGIAALARAEGVRFLAMQVDRFEIVAKRITRVLSKVDAIKADKIVIAAGAGSAALLRKLGQRYHARIARSSVAVGKMSDSSERLRELPMIATPNVSLRPAVDGTIVIGNGYRDWRADYDVTLRSLKDAVHFREYFTKYRRNLNINFRSLPTGILSAIRPSKAPRSDKVECNQAIVAENLQRAAQLLGCSSGALALARAWAGEIDFTPDGLPVIGQSDHLQNLYVATGFSGAGFGLGPGVGHCMAALMTAGKSPIDLTALGVDRFRRA